MTLVRLEPVAPQSQVKHSTTEPLRSLIFFCIPFQTLDLSILNDISLQFLNMGRNVTKPVFGVFDKVRLKPVLSATETT